MGRKRTETIIDYINDYEDAAKDYSEMGPLWAEMVFPDDFEALRALYGGKQNCQNDTELHCECEDCSFRR